MLDSGGASIFVFRGFLSTTLHRAKAFEMSLLMRQERVAHLGRCSVVQVDQGDEPDDFWKLVPSHASGGSGGGGGDFDHPAGVDGSGSVLGSGSGGAQRRLSAEAAEAVAEPTAALSPVRERLTVSPGDDSSPRGGGGSGGRRRAAALRAAWESGIDTALKAALERVVEDLVASSALTITSAFYQTSSTAFSSAVSASSLASAAAPAASASALASEAISAAGYQGGGGGGGSGGGGVQGEGVFDLEVTFGVGDAATGLTIRDVVLLMPQPAAAGQAQAAAAVEEPCVQVAAVDPDSAGRAAGVQPGDMLTSVNGRLVGHLTKRQVAEKIRAAGRPVLIGLRRGLPLATDGPSPPPPLPPLTSAPSVGPPPEPPPVVLGEEGASLASGGNSGGGGRRPSLKFTAKLGAWMRRAPKPAPEVPASEDEELDDGDDGGDNVNEDAQRRRTVALDASDVLPPPRTLFVVADSSATLSAPSCSGMAKDGGGGGDGDEKSQSSGSDLDGDDAAEEEPRGVGAVATRRALKR